MRRIISLALLLCCFVITIGAQSHAYKVEEIPMVHLQNRTRYVSNPDGILSAGAVAAMDTTLFALEQRTGVQTLVVAVKQIDGGDCFEFAYQLGKQNGVGEKGKDNGLVILLVTMHSVRDRIWAGRCPPRCSLQTDTSEIHEQVSGRRQLGCRHAGRHTGCQPATGWNRRTSRSPTGRRKRLLASHYSDMLLHHRPCTFMVQRTPAQKMSVVP